jgi:hypothetical protein
MGERLGESPSLMGEGWGKRMAFRSERSSPDPCLDAVSGTNPLPSLARPTVSDEAQADPFRDGLRPRGGP